ncbi:S-adenosylmethionine decarboxylase [Crepidotus variabilis]|uniref:adenosylmethionine decarboxylase n=1 Tax=Crepidotus variabilis TaxID=179855 RepID=A0A9P6JR88_9AGAR|nr:S-adenosylmethionine decarboxylase [Crepidotus variabilis]
MSSGDIDFQASGPFEGPEKLLEIWFEPSPADVPNINGSEAKLGLRAVPRQIWEDMLDIVKCKVLNVIEGLEMDAYLLSESSFFVSPHRLILKTCGTTLNLLGLPRIIEIAANYANMHTVHRFFYSRKSFMFPERQLGPHRDWKQEVEFLDRIFKNGAAYTIGKVNGDHWLLYMTTPDSVSPYVSHDLSMRTMTAHMDDRPLDFTIEILMTDLSPTASKPFFFSDSQTELHSANPSALGLNLSEKLGITDIFPPSLTHLDAYAFTPCGYSANALLRWGDESLNYDSDSSTESRPPSIGVNHTDKYSHAFTKAGHFGEGYYTIHVTPEDGWSYASFECNVPLSSKRSHNGKIPDLQTLVKRVVNIFQPGRITVSLFISSEDNDPGDAESAVEGAQKAFRAALTRETEDLHRPYKRTDKINYEFGGYDLAYASFELL